MSSANAKKPILSITQALDVYDMGKVLEGMETGDDQYEAAVDRIKKRHQHLDAKIETVPNSIESE